VQHGDIHSEQVGVISGAFHGVGSAIVRGAAVHRLDGIGVVLGILIVADAFHDASVNASTIHLVQQGGALELDSTGAVGQIDHGVGLQRVPDHLGSVVAAQGSGHVDGLDACIQAGSHSVGVDVDRPHGIVLVAFLHGIITQGHQQHLSQLGAGDVAGGSEAVAAHTGDDAPGGAVLDVLVGPGIGGAEHVVVGRLGGLLDGVSAAVQHSADHLGSLATLDVFGRLEAAVLVPVDDAQRRGHINGFGILDLILIRERRPSAHDHDRQQHSHTEHQAQNLLLGEMLAPQAPPSIFPTAFPLGSHGNCPIKTHHLPPNRAGGGRNGVFSPWTTEGHTSMITGRIMGFRLVFLYRYRDISPLMADLMVAQSTMPRT